MEVEEGLIEVEVEVDEVEEEVFDLFSRCGSPPTLSLLLLLLLFEFII